MAALFNRSVTMSHIRNPNAIQTHPEALAAMLWGRRGQTPPSGYATFRPTRTIFSKNRLLGKNKMNYLTPEEFDQYLKEKTMPGVPGRSGRPSAKKTITTSDGRPEAPRLLSEASRKHFEWLLDRLQVDEPGSNWRRIDGSLLASLAELLESLEQINAALAADPASDKWHRLRIQASDRIYKFSSLCGLCPRDRQRLPANEPQEPESEWD